MTTTWFIGSAVFLFLALHPLVTYPASLAVAQIFWRRFKPSRPDPELRPPGGLRFALCTCAYNEERQIESKLQNLLALAATVPDSQVLVYVDGASDRTAQIVEGYADRITVLVSVERHGKTYGMNLLVARTDADVLVFSDANVMLDSRVLQRLAGHFSAPNVGCVSGNLVYTNGAESATAQTGAAYWRWEQLIKRLEGTWGRVIGADGSLFAVRRALHRPPPEHIIDDMYVSLIVLLSGYRVLQADDVIAYERSVSVSSEEIQRKIRIACQAFNVHRLLWQHIKRMDLLSIYMYVSHKLLRWFSICFILLAGGCFLAGLASAGHPRLAILLVFVIVGGLFAGWRWRIKGLTHAADAVSALVGTGIGVVQSLRGKQYRTWQPAASIRKWTGTYGTEVTSVPPRRG